MTTDKLKPENVIKYGNGNFTNAPKVIYQAMEHEPSFTLHQMTGLSAEVHFCETCADTLDWITMNRRGEIQHNWNGSFRVQYREDQYLDGHYFRKWPEDKPEPIERCNACKKNNITGYRYKIDIEEIDYGEQCSLVEIELKTRVVVLGIPGIITGWTDSRPAKRLYHITFDNGIKGSFLNWQLRREKKT